MNIFSQLDELIRKSGIINESEETDFDDGFSTREDGVRHAVKQMKDMISNEPSDGGDGDSPFAGDDYSVDSNPIPDLKSSSGGSGEDKTFHDTVMDDMDDVEKIKDDKEKESGDSRKDMDDFEYDDFDYDEHSSGGGEDGDDTDKSSGSDEDSEDDSDDDFGVDDIGDEDDYDFGDDGDDGDGDDGGDGRDDRSSRHGSESDGPDMKGMSDGTERETEESTGDKRDSTGGSSTRSGVSGSGTGSETGSSSSSDSGDGGDVNYDDTLDYDAEDYDSLESEIKDALDRTSESAKGSGKSALEGMKDMMDGDAGGKSSSDMAEDLEKKLDDVMNDTSRDGSGELAGESLDKTPDMSDMAEDMRKGGFDEKSIKDMERMKDTDVSSEIDDEKVAKEAFDEMTKRAKDRGLTSSALAGTISRNVLKKSITNDEWKSMVDVFLKAKSRTSGAFGKSDSTSWGDKKHLWRDAVLPKTSSDGGDIESIYCFIDFSGSVSQPLVMTFLKKVLGICVKLNFKSVYVYGFGDELSKPFEIRKRDLKKDDNISKLLDEMWKFIYYQNLGGSIENFEAVAKEILKIKKKEHDAPVMIFGDGLWGVSYSNPKPPMYLKELCSRYIRDILVLIYYDEYYKELLLSENGYLEKVVGLKHIVTTSVKELE